jgi:hypothetical protein
MYVLRTMRGLWCRRPVRWALAFLGGALWWWAAVRLAAQPPRAGSVEGLVVAGGWGLGLVPLRSTPWSGSAPPERWPAAMARLPRPRTGAQPGHRHPAVQAEELARHES